MQAAVTNATTACCSPQNTVQWSLWRRGRRFVQKNYDGHRRRGATRPGARGKLLPAEAAGM